MAQTASKMLPLGTTAPNFKLMDTITGENKSLEECKGLKATVIMFICNHCPFVKHVNTELVRMAKDFKSKGINFIAISSNDVEKYPNDSPEKMKETAQIEGYIFPYLYDASQQTAIAFNAACTPDFYVFDDKLLLVYRGQMDDSRPGNDQPVNGSDIRTTLKALLNNQEIDKNQKPSMGCNIKWKTENL